MCDGRDGELRLGEESCQSPRKTHGHPFPAQLSTLRDPNIAHSKHPAHKIHPKFPPRLRSQPGFDMGRRARRGSTPLQSCFAVRHHVQKGWGKPKIPPHRQLDSNKPDPEALSRFWGPVSRGACWGGKDGWMDGWMQAGVGKMQDLAQGSPSPHLSILPPAIPPEGFKGKLI